LSIEQRWSRRDAAYAARKSWGQPVLTEDEVRGITWWRGLEASLLPEKERTKALIRLSMWTPPIGMRR
jgi:hypothetical protein